MKKKILMVMVMAVLSVRAMAFGTNPIVATPWTTTTNAAAALAALGGSTNGGSSLPAGVVTNYAPTTYLGGKYSTLVNGPTNPVDIVNLIEFPQAIGHYVFNPAQHAYTNSAATNIMFWYSTLQGGVWTIGTNLSDSTGVGNFYYYEGVYAFPTNDYPSWNITNGDSGPYAFTVAIGTLATSNNNVIVEAYNGRSTAAKGLTPIPSGIGNYFGQDYIDPESGIVYATVGFDAQSNNGKAGQFRLAGKAGANYGNISGMHFGNLASSGDDRAGLLRVKDPTGGTNANGGGYSLWESKYASTAPDADTTYANYLQVDQYGNVGLGDLHATSDQASDSLGANVESGKHPNAKVAIYGSPNYAPFAINYPAGMHLLAAPMTNAWEFDGTNVYWTDASSNRWILQKTQTNGTGTFTGTFAGNGSALNISGSTQTNVTLISSLNGTTAVSVSGAQLVDAAGNQALNWNSHAFPNGWNNAGATNYGADALNNTASHPFNATNAANSFSGNGAGLTGLNAQAFPSFHYTNTDITVSNADGSAGVDIKPNGTISAVNLGITGVVSIVGLGGIFDQNSGNYYINNGVIKLGTNGLIAGYPGVPNAGVADVSLQRFASGTWRMTNNLILPGTLTAAGFVSTAPHTPVAVTVGASPFTYSNSTPVALECYFSGGTAYSITKNGAAVYGSIIGNDYFKLDPTNICIITYTVAPTFYTNTW